MANEQDLQMLRFWEYSGWTKLAKRISRREPTNQVLIEIDILKRRWGCLGHALRMPNNSITRQALMRNPQGKRKKGRLKNTWRRDLEADIMQMGLSWQQLERIAQDRRRRRREVVHDLWFSRKIRSSHTILLDDLLFVLSSNGLITDHAPVGLLHTRHPLMLAYVAILIGNYINY